MSVDSLTPAERSKRMSLVRSKDTKPEILVRRLIYRIGYRYRLHVSKLPGKPDIVFSSRKKVIFVNGCFWHQHRDKDCRLSRIPKSRREFWKKKLYGNRERDLRNIVELERLGWSVLSVWECEMQNLDLVERKIKEFLE